MNNPRGVGVAELDSALSEICHSPTYGSSAMNRARLIAWVSTRWWRAQVPVSREGRILPRGSLSHPWRGIPSVGFCRSVFTITILLASSGWSSQAGAQDLLERARETTLAMLAEPYPAHIDEAIDQRIRAKFPIRLRL